MTRKAVVVVLVAGLALTGAALALWYSGRKDPAASSVQGHVEYSCPMHPKIVRDRPGECPVCGMKLEKRSVTPGSVASTASPAERRVLAPPVPGRATVALPADRAALLGIRSEPVSRRGTAGALRTVGRVAMDETRREAVHAKYEGYVERLLVDFTGQPVSKGQPLLTIYSPELVAAQQEYLVARRAQVRLGDSTVPGVAEGGGELAEAARQRLRYWDVGASDIAALEKSGTPLRTVTLRSPASGVVIEKIAVEGMKVSPADRLYVVVDLSRVWVLADVYEKDLGSVRVGTAARIVLPGMHTREWRGKVAFVSPTVKAETRTAEVRVEVDNRNHALKPDMFVDVHLESGSTMALSVPDSAVIFTGERTLVFVDRGEGMYEPREVSVGSRVDGAYEVLRGLAEGDRVVVGANFLLDSESSLRAAISSASGPR